MNKFIVRNNKSFTSYVKTQYGYFLRNKKEDIKITIRKNNVFIHISSYYCVICNDLKYLQRNNMLEADKKSINWLNKY